MQPADGTVLVTGANGFIGSRLVAALQAAGYRLRCLVRRAGAESAGSETCQGDLVSGEGLEAALAGVDSVFYLVHSMGSSGADFAQRDRQAARNFVAAAEAAGVRRVIYLGGLGETGDDLSHHLRSRLEVGEILDSGRFATTFLRAAVIIGAGGASFETIRSLVEHLPVMITPRWVSTRCQPIAVADVIAYLAGCLAEERTAGQTYDIGGPEILSYGEMLRRFAAIEGRPLLLIPIPLLTPRLSAYWVQLVTPIKASVVRPLIDGLKNQVVCREQRIRDLLPITLTPYDQAVRTALAEESLSPPATRR